MGVHTYQKISAFCARLQNAPADARKRYFVPCLDQYQVDARTYIIAWKRIVPLNMLDPATRTQLVHEQEKELIAQMEEALTYLASIGLCHGDARLDNIGWDDDHFALFDYDTSNTEACAETDLERFYGSVF